MNEDDHRIANARVMTILLGIIVGVLLVWMPVFGTQHDTKVHLQRIEQKLGIQEP